MEILRYNLKSTIGQLFISVRKGVKLPPLKTHLPVWALDFTGSDRVWNVQNHPPMVVSHWTEARGCVHEECSEASAFSSAPSTNCDGFTWPPCNAVTYGQHLSI